MGSPDTDTPADDADCLLDPDDTEDGFDADDLWPDDMGTGNGDTTRQGRRGQDRTPSQSGQGRTPKTRRRHGRRRPRPLLPGPAYTGLGLWDAHQEAEQW
ncbi:hypothetical protein HUT16_00065 [Kitasatospora sp. NA04385]|uniref:hypothetical protein n=1 Tax=Kitasatospora sp. NA04385 TaxID=2742135 RepID=UPI0015913FD6|nr:hypothetical protein [Kitasatospora sp. NA04385]QKW17673.1 hypothetical protein HUT16_00065 [Kitasatospora sp. NA04385]